MTVQQVIEKVNISKAFSLLSNNFNVDSFNIESGYLCFNCSFLLGENSDEIFDSLPELECSVPENTKIVLTQMVGYITRNDSASKVLTISRCSGQRWSQSTNGKCQW